MLGQYYDNLTLLPWRNNRQKTISAVFTKWKVLMMSQTETNPGNSRIVGYDFARAFAIFGMVLVNFSIVMNASEKGPVWLVALVKSVEGKAAATFVVLAGVGLSLLSAKARLSQDLDKIKYKRKALLKRALFLFIVGLLYMPIWDADILHFYGLYIALGTVLLTASSSQLWGAMGIFTFGFIGLFLIFDYDTGWNWETLEYIHFWTVEGLIRRSFFNGFHPVFPWVAFLFFGMWLGRQDITNPTFQKKALAGGLGTLVLAEMLSIGLITIFAAPEFGFTEDEIDMLFGTGPMPPMPQYLLAGIGSAVIVITLSIRITEKFKSSWWVNSFVMTGQLALTLYVAHVLIGMVVLELMGRLENQTLVFAVQSSLVFFGGSILFATLWRKRFSRGPLEWVMRATTGD